MLAAPDGLVHLKIADCCLLVCAHQRTLEVTVGGKNRRGAAKKHWIFSDIRPRGPVDSLNADHHNTSSAPQGGHLLLSVIEQADGDG